MKKELVILLTLALLSTGFVGCSTADVYAVTTITLGDKIKVEGGGATINGNSVTITDAGTYTITGTLTDGLVTVDSADQDVTLILDNASITNSAGPALLIKDAGRAIVTLADESNNYLKDGGASEYDAALYGCVSYMINGTGILDVYGTTKEGLVSEENLTIDGGIINITSVDDGINASSDDTSQIIINDGMVTITAGGDGIDSNGDLEINGGTIISIASAEDGNGGLDAGGALTINGGTVFASGTMLPTPDSASAQKSLMAGFDTLQDAGTRLTIKQGDTELLNTTPAQSYQAILFSSPDLIDAEEYEIYLGDTLSQTVTTDSVNSSMKSMGESQTGADGEILQGNPPARPDGETPQGDKPPADGNTQRPALPDGEMPQGGGQPPADGTTPSAI